MKTIIKNISILLCLSSFVALFVTGCEQYEYSSPGPGVLEIRFKTKSDAIPFSELNNFVMNVTEVNAIRNDDGRLNVYQDLKAIRRENSTYNIIQPLARDSMLVLGQAYAPPGNYKGINLQMKPQGFIILDGYRSVPVFAVVENSNLLSFVSSFPIEQGVTTYVTLTIDLDSSLRKGADWYYYYPYYYISSITMSNGTVIAKVNPLGIEERSNLGLASQNLTDLFIRKYGKLLYGETKEYSDLVQTHYSFGHTVFVKPNDVLLGRSIDNVITLYN